MFFVLLSLFLFPAILMARQDTQTVSIFVQMMLVILVTIICQFLRKEPVTLITGEINLRTLRQFIIGLLTGAVLMIFPAILLYLSGLLKWSIKEFSFSTIISGVTACITVAVVEEFLFRGFIFQRLIESLGRWPAQLIIAGMFLLTHINNPGMMGSVKLIASVNIFLASILFGVAFIKTKSLAVPIGIHFMANWVQGSFLGFAVSGNAGLSFLRPQFKQAPDWLTGGAFGLEASLPGFFILFIVTVVFYFWNPQRAVTFKPWNNESSSL